MRNLLAISSLWIEAQKTVYDSNVMPLSIFPYAHK